MKQCVKIYGKLLSYLEVRKKNLLQWCSYLSFMEVILLSFGLWQLLTLTDVFLLYLICQQKGGEGECGRQPKVKSSLMRFF